LSMTAPKDCLASVAETTCIALSLFLYYRQNRQFVHNYDRDRLIRRSFM
jgi:hypothetical protein